MPTLHTITGRAYDRRVSSFRQGTRLLVIFLLCVQAFSAHSQVNEIFQEDVALSRQNSSIYSILNQISGQTGYFFVYNTEILNSDKRIRIRAGSQPLSSWLEEILDDPSLDFHIIKNHILIYRPEMAAEDEPAEELAVPPYEEFVIRGRVLDENTRKPLPYVTVTIKGTPAGIITNSDGMFVLNLSHEHLDDNVFISHIGYKSQMIPVRLFPNNSLDILMETEYISIQEVMIRYYDPHEILDAARERIRDNYSNQPVYLLNFYREGVMRSNRFINYSEALFQVYKPPYFRQIEREQVRLLQSRTISNTDQTDTLLLRIRAGIRSSLELDFIRNTPDFLDREFSIDYDFKHADLVTLDGRRTYAIAFEQKKHITDPFHTGILYIDMESLAFMGAEFELHPKYINKATSRFITGRNRSYRATLEKAEYSVRYRFYNGVYHLSHVRADLEIRYRRRLQIFSNTYNAFVEMATTRIETENVRKFDRREQWRTDRVFIDQNHLYDPEFWSNYSIIAPEKQITQAISLIESKIESIIGDIVE